MENNNNIIQTSTAGYVAATFFDLITYAKAKNIVFKDRDGLFLNLSHSCNRLMTLFFSVTSLNYANALISCLDYEFNIHGRFNSNKECLLHYCDFEINEKELR